MTEKRFNMSYDDGLLRFVKDSITENNLDIIDCCSELNELSNMNEQLKQDNNILIKLLENQSIIIQELHSKLLEYRLKEPIVLTKEDLEIMGKAISYYTHGKCPE